MIGVIIICIARKNTKSFWRIIPPNKVKTNGIYKYIRHPMYLGNILFCFGIFGWLVGIKLSICLTYLYIHFVMDRIDREEQMLVMIFGDDYIEYMKRTTMLIPFIF